MPLQIPHPNTPLHLYRHLLREASYLPPLCRPWITSRIQTRYRDCETKKDTKPYIQEAHHHLRYLRSANAGHVARILHLCYLATGRVGKRRRQLATLFLTKEPPTDTDDLESDILYPDHPDHENNISSKKSSSTTAPNTSIATSTLIPTRISTINSDKKRNSSKLDAFQSNREPDWLDNWATDKIHLVAASQVANQGGMWPHTMRKSYDPKHSILTENAFGRPFPKRVARNKLKRHYASVLHQLLPPLPQGEWDRLRDLANGRASSPDDMKMPPRRTVAQPIIVDKDEGKGSGSGSGSGVKDLSRDDDWMKYATKPARALERKSSRRMKSLTSELDQDPRGQGRPIGVRNLGPRTLRRRIYGQIFEISPTLAQNPYSGRLMVKWGGKELKVSKPTTEIDRQFFRGVDRHGKVPTEGITKIPL